MTLNKVLNPHRCCFTSERRVLFDSTHRPHGPWPTLGTSFVLPRSAGGCTPHGDSGIEVGELARLPVLAAASRYQHGDPSNVIAFFVAYCRARHTSSVIQAGGTERSVPMLSAFPPELLALSGTFILIMAGLLAAAET